jgi:capsular polysaccharide biosynthesis protein
MKKSILFKFPIFFLGILNFFYFIKKKDFFKIRIDLLNTYRNKQFFFLKRIHEIKGINVIYEENESINTNILPVIYNLCEGGTLFNTLPGRKILEINHAKFYLNSDFIRLENNEVLNEKLFKKEYKNLIPCDSDIIEINGGNIFTLKDDPDSIYSNSCFYFNGTFLSQWGHFILEHLAKLEMLEYIKLAEMEVFLPLSTDNHIKSIVSDYLFRYPNIKLRYISSSTKVCAKKIYVPINNTFIGNNSDHYSPLYIQISDSTVNFVTRIMQSYRIKNITSEINLFIGYKGKRGLLNYSEVESIFIKNGYFIVYPHELNFIEKVNLFSSAKNIVGIGSSAFTNTIFCAQGINILALVPNNRSLDTGMTKFNVFLNQKCFYFTGKDSNGTSLSTNFEIDLNELIQFSESNNFLQNKN